MTHIDTILTLIVLHISTVAPSTPPVVILHQYWLPHGGERCGKGNNLDTSGSDTTYHTGTAWWFTCRN